MVEDAVIETAMPTTYLITYQALSTISGSNIKSSLVPLTAFGATSTANPPKIPPIKTKLLGILDNLAGEVILIFTACAVTVSQSEVACHI